MTDLLDSIAFSEGFRSEPYQDHLGNWTFGHGLTWISEAESLAIVAKRIRQNHTSLCEAQGMFRHLSPAIQHVLIEMAFQMGVSGTLQFKKMWAALEQGENLLAADEMLDSMWAVQTPNRAQRLAAIVRGVP